MPFKSPYPDIEIPNTNVLSYLFPPNSQPSDRPIWIDSQNTDRHLSPRQALDWIKRLAVGFDKMGIKKQEVVMIFTPNHIFLPVAYLGIVGSGRAFSGANPAYNVKEMVYQIKNTETTLILAHPTLLKTAVAASGQAGLPAGRIFQFSDVENSTVNGIPDFRAMLGTPEEGARYTWDTLRGTADKTVATINYSSGTTGLPKGVCVSHYNLNANVEQHIYLRELHRPDSRGKERWLGFLPLFHAYGQLWVFLMAIKLNNPVWVMEKFGYEDFLRVIEKQKITHLQVAPPIVVMLGKRPETEKYDLSSLTDIMCGAAPLYRELQNDVTRRFNVKIIQGWGMTELTCGALHVPGGLADDTGSVGQLDPNCECKLLSEEGQEVPPGEPGEVYIRGPNVCMRYWRNDAATAESISPDGWLKTGDVAIVRDRQPRPDDPEGVDNSDWFWIVDRKKELIKVNALQVAPAELEAVLLENDDVADAAVVGITLHGEEWPRAYVSLTERSRGGKVTEEGIQEWMKGKVAKHKRLVGGVVFIDEVPKLASGKIQRKVLREWAKRDAGSMEGRIKARL